MASQKIDRDKLRIAIRKLNRERVFDLLDEAIDLLPESKLLKLVKQYFNPSKLRPDSEAKGNLLRDVKVFEKASLAGEYYESFNVNSKNYMEKSEGTETWIAEYDR